MNGKFSNHKTWKVSLMAMIIILALLSTATSAFATYRVINLNDNSVDPNWQVTPAYTSTCSNGSIVDRDEIKRAWVTNSDPSGADQGWYYWRIETCAGPALSSTTTFAAIQIDCNGDGDFVDPGDLAGDRSIAFTQNDSSNIDQWYVLDGGGTVLAADNDPGDGGFTCAPSPVYHGERPGKSASTATSVEWGFQFCGLPAGCRGATSNNWPISMKFGTAKQVTGGFNIIDQSSIIHYSTPPTAITLNSISATSPAWQNPVVLFSVSILAAVLAVGLFFLRRKIYAIDKK